MKKLFFLFVFCLLLTFTLFAQEAETEVALTGRCFSIMINPLYAIFGIGISSFSNSLIIIDLESQFKINNCINVSLITSYLSRWWSYNHFVFKPMFIYRPFKTGLDGFYLGLYYCLEIDNKFGIGASNGAGLNIGYKKIFENGFTLQLGVGIGIRFGGIANLYMSATFFSPDGRIVYHGLEFQLLDFKIGYSFRKK